MLKNFFVGNFEANRNNTVPDYNVSPLCYLNEQQYNPLLKLKLN
jgi:hypothetical protein